MYSLQMMFDKITLLVTAIESQATDASKRAESFLRESAEWVKATREKLVAMEAGPGDDEKISDLIARCDLCKEEATRPAAAAKDKQECDPESTHAPKGFGLPGNPILMLVLQFASQWLSQLAMAPPKSTEPTE